MKLNLIVNYHNGKSDVVYSGDATKMGLLHTASINVAWLGEALKDKNIKSISWEVKDLL